MFDYVHIRALLHALGSSLYYYSSRYYYAEELEQNVDFLLRNQEIRSGRRPGEENRNNQYGDEACDRDEEGQ